MRPASFAVNLTFRPHLPTPPSDTVFSQNLILVSVLFAVAMIFASLGSMVVMKTILGRYSRQLIGA